MKKKRNLIRRVKQKSFVELLKEKIKKNKKSLSISCVIIALIIIGALVMINFNKSKAMDTASLLTDQTVDDLEFVNATIENNKLKVVVHNLDDMADYNLKTIDVSYLDSDGNVITTIKGYIGNTIEKDGMRQLVVSTDASLDNAKKIKYTINK